MPRPKPAAIHTAIRLHPEEDRLRRLLAEKRGLSLTALVGQLIREAAKREGVK